MQSTPLVGRGREVREVAERVRSEEVRLLTLIGPGGTGKTRLALQAAADLLEEFSDGVFFVALATITEPGLVASTIARVLGVKESAEQSLMESLKNYLRDKHLLLVLDNFEQVLEGSSLVGEQFQGRTLVVVGVGRSRVRAAVGGGFAALLGQKGSLR